tara:strand:- start:15 stop:332 length:318 start_codon:yes stop_codon:yes gene_type:complete
MVLHLFESGASEMSEMAVGIPIGVAIGIGTGVAVGKKKARDELREYAEQQTITIQDREGQPVPIDTFLSEAMGGEDAKSRKTIRVLLALGVLLFLLGVVVYFSVR